MQHSANDPAKIRKMVDIGRERTCPEDLLLERLVDRQQRERLEQAGQSGRLDPEGRKFMATPGPGLALGAGTGAAKGVPSELGRFVQDEGGDCAAILDVEGATHGSGELLFRD